MRYRYSEQLSRARRGEAAFAAWLARSGRPVRAATLAEQYSGIDVFVELFAAHWCSVELKADWMSERTGNFFIETVSSIAKGSPGWAYTVSADWLALVSGVEVYWVRPGRLPTLLASEWLAKYGTREVSNDNGNTRGCCVPKSELRRATGCRVAAMAAPLPR